MTLCREKRDEHIVHKTDSMEYASEHSTARSVFGVQPAGPEVNKNVSEDKSCHSFEELEPDVENCPPNQTEHALQVIENKEPNHTGDLPLVPPSTPILKPSTPPLTDIPEVTLEPKTALNEEAKALGYTSSSVVTGSVKEIKGDLETISTISIELVSDSTTLLADSSMSKKVPASVEEVATTAENSMETSKKKTEVVEPPTFRTTDDLMETSSPVHTHLITPTVDDFDDVDLDDEIPYELTEDEEDKEMRNFFPATRESFTELAGEVKRVTRLDFEDDNRRRHLECFARSMDHWAAFDKRESAANANISFMKINFDRYNDMLLNLDTSDFTPLNNFIVELVQSYNKDMKNKELNLRMSKLRRKYRIAPSKREILEGLESLQDMARGNKCSVGDTGVSVRVDSHMKYLLRNKATRSNSGVVVITVMTSPGSFSCSENCHYCPNEPGQPRSYLSTEPAVLRANQNYFDAVKQFYDRATTLYKNGHIIDKIEIIVLGGTWSGYPRNYQEDFIRDIFYAANVFPEPIESARSRESLEREHQINETANSRIIGLTLETRPDRITPYEIELLRKYGCTRVQLGIQHTDNEILKYVNRGHTIEDSIKAIYLLKENCFKVDIHIMPDLPSSSVEKDYKMFDYILTSEDLQADQWKIYPCEVTPFTEIERWYKQGIFVPYFDVDDTLLLKLLMSVKRAVHPWIRLNRVIRDIPNPSIIAGTKIINMRQIILDGMNRRSIKCKCIRCREVKDTIPNDPKLIIRQYHTKGGTEYFLSYENHSQSVIYGFLRLRIRNNADFNPKISNFKVLEHCALIRELHVYGIVVAHGKSAAVKTPSQHRGIGASLLLAAEIISIYRGFWKVAIIAGVGTREYYSRYGYKLRDTYMIKDLNSADVLGAYMENVNSDRLVKLPKIIDITLFNLLNSSICLYSELPEEKPSKTGPVVSDNLPVKLPDINNYRINVRRLLHYVNARNDNTDDYLKSTNILDRIHNFIDEVDLCEFLGTTYDSSKQLAASLFKHPFTCASVAFFAYSTYKHFAISQG